MSDEVATAQTPARDAAAVAIVAAKARAYADVFRLPLNHRTWRGQSGDFQGGGVGSSLDFQDHRSYMPGDDPRHINWQAYARTGSYSMKLYREEVRPIIDVVLDVSGSMTFDAAKWNRAIELLYFAVYSAIKSGATISVTLVKGEEIRSLTDDLIHSFAWVGLIDEMAETAASAAPDLRRVNFRAQSMRIFISDLLFPAAPDAILQMLIRGKGHGILMAPYLLSEADPGWEGTFEFVDSEEDTRHPHRVDRSLLAKYLLAYGRHFELWKAVGQKYDTILARVPSESTFLKALQIDAVAAGAVEVS